MKIKLKTNIWEEKDQEKKNAKFEKFLYFMTIPYAANLLYYIITAKETGYVVLMITINTIAMMIIFTGLMSYKKYKQKIREEEEKEEGV